MPEKIDATPLNLSPWTLFWEADWVVKLVMFGLIAASIWSWAIIIDRRARLKKLGQEATVFENDLESNLSIDALYEKARLSLHPMALIFTAGMNEWRASVHQGCKNHTMLQERIGTAIRVQIEGSIADFSRKMNILATTGAVAPFVGLFGTVWGIMGSFSAIAGQQSTSLAVVAPGIAEALFATAIGLFAAIPAVVGYNWLTQRAAGLEQRLERFAATFQNLVSRQIDS